MSDSKQIILPMDLLEKCLGGRIIVKLTGGHQLDGVLERCDSTGTLLLRDATSSLAKPRKYVEYGTVLAQRIKVELHHFDSVIVHDKHIQVLIPSPHSGSNT